MPSKKQRARERKQNKEAAKKSTQTELTKMKKLEKRVKNNSATNNYCNDKNGTKTGTVTRAGWGFL